MFSRTYTVDHNDSSPLCCYKGFNHNLDEASKMDLIGLIKWEDSIEIYVLDDTRKARNEFARYVAEQFLQGASIIGIYQRTKFYRRTK